MDDRELLELAAKAAGIEHPGGEHCLYGPALWDCQRLCWWRPLTDDGDALRLAVKLRLEFKFLDGFKQVICRRHECRDQFETQGMVGYGGGCDPEPTAENVRRAIVRSAAEIGRSMP